MSISSLASSKYPLSLRATRSATTSGGAAEGRESVAPLGEELGGERSAEGAAAEEKNPEKESTRSRRRLIEWGMNSIDRGERTRKGKDREVNEEQRSHRRKKKETNGIQTDPDRLNSEPVRQMVKPD